MAYGTRVGFEAVREAAFGAVTGSFTSLGAPTSEFVRLISISNSTNADVYVSFDGVTNHLRMSAGSFKLFDFSSNKVRDDGLFIGVGTQIYIKYVSTLGTSGNVWAECMHAEGGV